MWTWLARIILRNRALILVFIGILTIFMAIQAWKVSISYEYVSMLPEDDPAALDYVKFRKVFKENSNLLVIGFRDPDFYQLDRFQQWMDLCDTLRKLPHVQSLLSVSDLYTLQKDTLIHKFRYQKVFEQRPRNQAELDSLAFLVKSLPFYEGFLYNDTSKVYLLGISIEKSFLDSKGREGLVEKIQELTEHYGQRYGLEMHHSGLPYTRTVIAKMIRGEMGLFIVLAILVTTFFIFLFFRSLQVVLISTLVVAVSVVCSIGTMGIFGYSITILSGMIPPLIIVIGIPNCIYLLNKYQQEYKAHGNKVKALQRVISRIGSATFLINLTAASGFGAFSITENEVLRQFGVVSSLNIMGIFALSLALIPIIYSFLPPPSDKQTSHLDSRFIQSLIGKIIDVVQQKRLALTLIVIAVVVVSAYGLSLMKITGFMVDDISRDTKVYRDLKFFEQHFKGVMPLEIMVDTQKKNGVLKLSTIEKINDLQDSLETIPEVSQCLSLAEATKFLKQAFYNGNPDYYSIPDNQEKTFLLSYLDLKDRKRNLLKSYVDSTGQIARISATVADAGTTRMDEISRKIQGDIDSIFPAEKYKVTLTGMSILYLRGTQYLINNLISSLILAILLISIIMAMLFTSWRMILISLIPNLIPQIVTAGLMGFFGIPIKPSTILVFSIAYGISVDGAIQFLNNYRHQLRMTSWNIKQSVLLTLQETGVSMFYTATILFFGFGIFAFSGFGGTQALGILMAVTLLVALFGNLILLPSLLLKLDQMITTRAFQEPMLVIFDEEEDIDLDELTRDKRSDEQYPD